MAGKFNWDDYEDADSSKGFSWDDYEDAGPSKTEAVLRGGAQGLSANLADEGYAGIKAMYEDMKALFGGSDANKNGARPRFDEFGRVSNPEELTGNYERYRDEYRAADKEAEKAHPLLYKGSEIGGSVAGAFIPGAGGIKGAAALGGASGFGMSEADNIKDLAWDTGKGAAIGAGTAYAIPKGFELAKWAGKKTGNVLFGVGEEATEKYLQNPQAVRSAKPLSEVTDSFLKKVDEVSRDTSLQSGRSFNELERHVHDVATVTDPLVESASRLRVMGEIGKERKGAIKFLEDIADDVNNIADKSGKLSLEKGKQVLGILDSEIERLTNLRAEAQSIRAISEARKNLDGVLKEISPVYKKQMENLAADTKAAVGIGSKFRTEGGAENLMKRISRGKDRFSKEALENFDERFGTEFAGDLENAAVKNQFTRETTNGSRRTLLGSALGGLIGSAVGGPLGGSAGAATGAAAGAAVDKMGGQIWQAVLDGSLKVGPYAKVLQKAMESGPARVAITHAVLMKNNPDYRAAVEGSQNGDL